MNALFLKNLRRYRKEAFIEAFITERRRYNIINTILIGKDLR